MKAYVKTYKNVADEKAQHGFRWDILFAKEKENAMTWNKRATAEEARDWFERREINIDLPDGSRHLCTGFQIDEVGPQDFVIFCEAPFNEA